MQGACKYRYEYFKRYFDINFNSPSMLSWKYQRTKYFTRFARNAGSFNKVLNIWIVNLKSINYCVNRIVWCLHNKKDLPDNCYIHHLDKNKSNNFPSNLFATDSKVISKEALLHAIEAKY